MEIQYHVLLVSIFAASSLSVPVFYLLLLPTACFAPQIMQFLLRARPSSHRNKALPTKCPVINFNALVISEHDGWSYQALRTLSSSFLRCNFYLAFWLLLLSTLLTGQIFASFSWRTWCSSPSLLCMEISVQSVALKKTLGIWECFFSLAKRLLFEVCREL